jgi:hypothetical protein
VAHVGRWPPVAYGHHHVTARGVMRALMGDWCEPFKQPLRITSGPRHFSDFFKIFNLPKFEIQISDLPDVQNSPNFA